MVTDTLSQSLLVPELRGDSCKLQSSIQGIYREGREKEKTQKQLNKDSILNSKIKNRNKPTVTKKEGNQKGKNSIINK